MERAECWLDTDNRGSFGVISQYHHYLIFFEWRFLSYLFYYDHFKRYQHFQFELNVGPHRLRRSRVPLPVVSPSLRHCNDCGILPGGAREKFAAASRLVVVSAVGQDNGQSTGETWHGGQEALENCVSGGFLSSSPSSCSPCCLARPYFTTQIWSQARHPQPLGFPSHKALRRLWIAIGLRPVLISWCIHGTQHLRHIPASRITA